MKSILFYALLFVSCYSLHAQVNLESGLVAYYPLNGNALDESGNGLHAELIDAPLPIQDCTFQDGMAYGFDGIDDVITVPHTEVMNFGTDDEFAISAWFKVPPNQANGTGTGADIIGKWTSAAVNVSYPFAIRVYGQSHINAGKIFAARFDGSCDNRPIVVSTTTFNNTKWNHIVFQRTANDELELYVNGVLENMVPDITTCPISNTDDITFGMRSPQFQNLRPYTGGLDEVRFYDRALNQEEIEVLYAKLTSTLNPDSALDKLVQVYPNPVTGCRVTVNIGDNEADRIEVFDASGRLIGQIQSRQLPALKAGVYFLKIFTKEGWTTTRRLIVHGCRGQV